MGTFVRSERQECGPERRAPGERRLLWASLIGIIAAICIGLPVPAGAQAGDVSAEKLRRLSQYFAALHGRAEFPLPVCNAPWVSTVIEADGTIRPCFFHPPFGNIHNQPLATILNSAAAVAFREQLDVQRDSTCRKCVCTLHLAAGEIEQIPG